METSGGIVLTAVGPDRPGLINQLSAIVTEAGGNIEDTRMAKLGGEFAVLVFVTGSESKLVDVAEQRARIESSLGLSCFIKPTHENHNPPAGLHYAFQVSGLDRPGIVESVSEVLAHRGINVSSLSSWVSHAPLSGTPMFMLEADLQVPPTVNLGQLRRDLADACERENLDFSLEPGRN